MPVGVVVVLSLDLPLVGAVAPHGGVAAVAASLCCCLGSAAVLLHAAYSGKYVRRMRAHAGSSLCSARYSWTRFGTSCARFAIGSSLSWAAS